MQQRQRCLPDGSSVKREFQALFCEKPEVQSLRLTLPICARLHHSGDLCQSCQFATHRLGVNEGLVMVASPPDELDRYFKAEEARWRKMIKGGIKVK